MTLGALVCVAGVSIFLLPAARDAVAAGELAGAALVLGFWIAGVGAMTEALGLGWFGVGLMLGATLVLVLGDLGRRLGVRRLGLLR